MSDTVGAVYLKALGPDSVPISTGKVGSGFSRRDRDQLKVALDAGYMVPVEVRHNGLSKSGALRHPVFVCFRADIDPTDGEALGVKQFLNVQIVT